jgi:hypothetical protein
MAFSICFGSGEYVRWIREAQRNWMPDPDRSVKGRADRLLSLAPSVTCRQPQLIPVAVPELMRWLTRMQAGSMQVI